MARAPSSVWTPELEARFLQALDSGCFIETAAAYAGITKRTYYERLKRGARELARLEQNPRSKPDPAREADVKFHQQVARALAACEVRSVALIGEAAKVQWQAAAWFLERKFPDRWGKRDYVTILQKLADRVHDASDDDLLALLAGDEPAGAGPAPAVRRGRSQAARADDPDEGGPELTD